MLQYLGQSAVTSAPKGKKLHASEVPSLQVSNPAYQIDVCQQKNAETYVAKPNEIPTKKHPARAAEL
jgi:hypothetical protein